MTPSAMRKTAEALRAEADRIEAEQRKAERLATASTIPTCPRCGGRVFSVDAHTIATGSISYEDDADGEWDGDSIVEGEHTDENAGATCAQCGADARRMLERHGWQFYGDPTPADSLDATDPDPDDPWPPGGAR